MRLPVAAAVLLLLAGCAHSGERAAMPSTTTASRHINLDSIRRVRRNLPPGYEAKTLSEVVAPQTIWGIGADGAASPARCATLAEPAGVRGQPAHGISGSGVGGTIYAVVFAAPTGPVALDHSLAGSCRQWTMTGRGARARVRLVDPPAIDGAETLGMTVEITTSVEGGNEINSSASTFTAYLGDYYAFTTVISDPGSPNPALTPQFAADLLAQTVSALRS